MADELVRQWFFVSPVEDYYQAVVAALKSGERVAFHPEQDEEAVRDFLARMLRALDERRPWPVPPFVELDPSDWPAFRKRSRHRAHTVVVAGLEKAAEPRVL